MRETLSMLVVSLCSFVALAADPPAVKELSPVVVTAPKLTEAIPVEVNKYRWFSIGGYTGPVTWQTTGKSVGMKETDKPLTLFGVVSGQTDPGEYAVPTGALIVWGKEQGTTLASAWGVVDGKAKQLLSLSFIVGPAPPGPVDPDVVPVPVVKSFRVIFVKGNKNLPIGQNSIPGALSIQEYLTRKTTPEGGLVGFREYMPNTDASNDLPAMRAVWAAAQPLIKPTDPPCVVIEVNGKVDIFPYEKDVAAQLAKLQTFGGK